MENSVDDTLTVDTFDRVLAPILTFHTHSLKQTLNFQSRKSV